MASTTALSQEHISEILDVIGPQIQPVTALSDANDDYCLIKANIPAGAVVPLHSHADRETFFILTGELQALRNDHWITLVSGDVLDVPGGLRHAWRNRSSAPVALLIVTNMRLGRFLREIGRPAATVAQGPPTAADFSRLMETAQAYGYWVGTAAENAKVGISLG